jgi:hypothetical protein
MHPIAYRVTGNAHPLSTSARRFAVCGNGELEHDLRPALSHAANMPDMIAPGRGGFDADIHAESCTAQAETTRVMPDAITASAQGGDLPWWEHGSSVT